MRNMERIEGLLLLSFSEFQRGSVRGAQRFHSALMVSCTRFSVNLKLLDFMEKICFCSLQGTIERRNLRGMLTGHLIHREFVRLLRSLQRLMMQRLDLLQPLLIGRSGAFYCQTIFLPQARNRVITFLERIT